MADIQIIIENEGKLYWPVITGNISIQWERKGAPGKLTFDVLPDAKLNFQEGNHVRLCIGGRDVFYGFVFTKKRNKKRIISVVAYDQLRYFKNKETYVYTDKTADELIRMIAEDFNLNCGVLAPAGYRIGQKIEQDKTLFDIVLNALDLTMQNAEKMFVLYDDAGKLTLRDVNDLRVNLLIDENNGQDFNYSTSIDSSTYNKIKLTYENKQTARRDIYISQSTDAMNRWGVLQYTGKLEDAANGKAKCDALLSLYNQKTRQLSIKKAFGDLRVRGGSSLGLQLNLGDIVANQYFIVEKVSHTINAEEHWMDLDLMGGGGFVG